MWHPSGPSTDQRDERTMVLDPSGNILRRQTREFICHPFAGTRLRDFCFFSTHPVLNALGFDMPSLPGLSSGTRRSPQSLKATRRSEDKRLVLHGLKRLRKNKALSGTPEGVPFQNIALVATDCLCPLLAPVV